MTTISEKNVVTRSAYLLFYRRRQPYTPYIWQAPADPEPEEEELEVEPQREPQQEHDKAVQETGDEPEEMDDKWVSLYGVICGKMNSRDLFHKAFFSMTNDKIQWQICW